MRKKHLLPVIVLFITAVFLRVASHPINPGYLNNSEDELKNFVKSDGEIIEGDNSFLKLSEYITSIRGNDYEIIYSSWGLRNRLEITDEGLNIKPPGSEGGLHPSGSFPQEDFFKEIDKSIENITGQGFVDAMRRRKRVTALQEQIVIHEVKPGENLSTIARKHDINIDTLIGANDIKDMNNIMPGDELTILPLKGIKYSLSPGESIEEIADKYGLQPAKIRRANEIAPGEELNPGDTLILPGAEPEFGYKDRLNQKLVRPVDGRVTSPFGPRWGGHHDGVDYAVPYGTPVRAAGAGTVVHTGYSQGYGHTVILEHQKGMRTLYAHLSSYEVTPGQRVGRGQVIAKSGNTGRSTGPHLHFEVRMNGRPVDPKNYLLD